MRPPAPVLLPTAGSQYRTAFDCEQCAYCARYFESGRDQCGGPGFCFEPHAGMDRDRHRELVWTAIQQAARRQWTDLRPGRDDRGASHVAVEFVDSGDKCAHRRAGGAARDGSRPVLPGRVLDLSMASAKALGLYVAGTGTVRIDVFAVPAPIDTGGRWCVQIGAFKDEDEAEKLTLPSESQVPDRECYRVHRADRATGCAFVPIATTRIARWRLRRT